MPPSILKVLVGLLIAQFVGCNALSQHANTQPTIARGNLHAANPTSQFEYGRDAPVVDSLGNLVGIPRKLLLWNRRVKNHRVSDETETELQRYLNVNDLSSVKVRVNQYAPVQEWRRLRDNNQVGPLWRYTAGTFSMLGYTLFPGRIFGHDNYNPYTNTVSIYSDIPSLGIAEMAYAKDIQQANYPGLYAFTQEFAGLDVIHTTRSTQDALDYLAVHASFDDLQEGYNILYPAMGMQVGDSVGSFVPSIDLSLGIVGAAAGHVAGRAKSRELAPFQQENP